MPGKLKLTVGAITSEGSAELTDPTCGDLAHWLGVAGLYRYSAIVIAGETLARAEASGSYPGLPEGITLTWSTVGRRRVVRIEWVRRDGPSVSVSR
jgi:hypothetical protein